MAGVDKSVYRAREFAHIVRLDKMKAYNQVNLINGYGILTIVTPKEALYEN